MAPAVKRDLVDLAIKYLIQNDELNPERITDITSIKKNDSCTWASIIYSGAPTVFMNIKYCELVTNDKGETVLEFHWDSIYGFGWESVNIADLEDEAEEMTEVAEHTTESRTMELAEYLATPMGKAFYRSAYQSNLHDEQMLRADDWSDERTQGELGDDARNLALQDVCSHLGFDPVEASQDLWQCTPRSLNGTIARSKDAHKIARAIKLGS